MLTLPVDLWSRCQLTGTPIQGPSIVNVSLNKARAVAEHILHEWDLRSGLSIDLSFSRDMPVGKGLSSSTADMLAVVRAFQQAFAVDFSGEFIARLFTAIEPHDALHYPTSVAYNHRHGRLLKSLNYTPDFCIIGVDAGGELSTLSYNHRLSFTTEQLRAYDALYAELLAAFERHDDVAIARCASRSAKLHVERTGDALLAELLTEANALDALDVLGVLATHSGTCGGLLLAGNAEMERLRFIETRVSTLGRVFTTHTLKS